MEFTIGRKYAGLKNKGPICIGFNKGNMSKGILYVDDPDKIIVIPQRSINIAKVFEQIIQKSEIEPYDRNIN